MERDEIDLRPLTRETVARVLLATRPEAPMPMLIWSKVKDGLDPSMKKKAYAFFEKLQESDKPAGLHIEPIVGSVDPRVRTGRVDDNFRCVLFKITAGDEPVYVIHGVWPHDKANAIAERVRLSMNPINGVPEVERVLDEVRAEARVATPARSAPEPDRSWELAAAHAPAPDVLAPEATAPIAPEAERAPRWPDGLTTQVLHGELGIDAELAEAALAAPTDSALVDVLGRARVDWQIDALLDLATGTSVDQVRKTFHLDEPVSVAADDDEDTRLLKAPRAPGGTGVVRLDRGQRRATSNHRGRRPRGVEALPAPRAARVRGGRPARGRSGSREAPAPEKPWWRSTVRGTSPHRTHRRESC